MTWIIGCMGSRVDGTKVEYEGPSKKIKNLAEHPNGERKISPVKKKKKKKTCHELVFTCDLREMSNRRPVNIKKTGEKD